MHYDLEDPKPNTTMQNKGQTGLLAYMLWML